jgi:hypothetical protein
MDKLVKCKFSIGRGRGCSRNGRGMTAIATGPCPGVEKCTFPGKGE